MDLQGTGALDGLEPALPDGEHLGSSAPSPRDRRGGAQVGESCASAPASSAQGRAAVWEARRRRTPRVEVGEGWGDAIARLSPIVHPESPCEWRLGRSGAAICACRSSSGRMETVEKSVVGVGDTRWKICGCGGGLLGGTRGRMYVAPWQEVGGTGQVVWPAGEKVVADERAGGGGERGR